MKARSLLAAAAFSSGLVGFGVWDYYYNPDGPSVTNSSLWGFRSADSAFIPPASNGNLTLYFIDVGQGDCTLVTFPSGKTLLIDCGSVTGNFDAGRVRSFIENHLPTNHPQIDLLLITHPDRDHYNKIVRVLANEEQPQIPVAKIMYSGGSDEYDADAKVEAWLEDFPQDGKIVVTDQSYNVYPPKSLPGFEKDGVYVLAANVPATDSPTNARTIVLKISYGSVDVILAGDATKDTDKEILKNFRGRQDQLDIEVWKGAHHGSWTTATKSDNWAKVIKPETIVFSASSDNGFGHPNINLVRQYTGYTTPAPNHPIHLWEKKDIRTAAANESEITIESIYSTSESGTITISSDGNDFSIATEK